jgi:hypothetical protein
MNERSIAEIDEANLVEILCRARRERIIQLKGIPENVGVFRCVQLAGVPGDITEGDVDILLCSPKSPELATAIEVKRVKVGSKAIRTEKPNKLRDLKKGVEQANKLAKVGFWQVYLYVFILVDSREQNLGKLSYAGAPSEIKSAIDRAIEEEARNLSDRVGLYKCEFTQPMDYPPLGLGAFGCYLLKHAERTDQTAELTEWVAGVVTGSLPALSCIGKGIAGRASTRSGENTPQLYRVPKTGKPDNKN